MAEALISTPAERFDRSTARLAGALYLVVVAAGIFSLAYVPGRMPGDDAPAATVAWLQANETLFRVSIAAALLCYAAFLVLPLALYRLLGRVDRTAALLMTAFATASVPIALINTGKLIEVLSAISGPDGAPAELAGRVAKAFSAYDDGLLLCQLFWGLWLAPFGYLVFRSGALPKLLGALLMLASIGYTVDLFCEILVSGYATSGVGRWITLPRLSEILTCLYLLIIGVKADPLARRASIAAGDRDGRR
ncbi:DUF4386 domain-containing protein [Phenylobacterium sp. LjRoot225]|uniref:DUF4386 domain-containing protein n=1 Tax=Phenylobacterium sp. LjRoot225 TaxID=3342285 RepID=UPI003ECED771